MAHTAGENPWLPWLVCLTASLFFFYEFIQMHMFNAISNGLMQAFSLNATGLGKLSASYFCSNIVFLIPAAMILDRFSTRRIVLIALTICILGTYAFAWANSLWLAVICRALTGVGSAFCFLSCIRLASRWFAEKRMALISSLIVTMAMLGGVVAQAPLTLLTQFFGWRIALTIDALVGLIILILIALIVQDYPAQLREQYLVNRQQLHLLGYWHSLRLSYLRWQNWLCGIYTSLMNLPIFLLGGIWGGLYLTHVHKFSTQDASYITSMLFIGTIIGSPTMGWLSDRMASRKLPMRVGAIMAFMLIIMLIYMGTIKFFPMLFLFFALGFITSAQIISYPLVAESNTKLLTATAVSVVSISAISGGAIFEPFFGWLVDMHHHLVTGNNLTGYSSGDFQFALWLFPITFAIAIAVSLLIKENNP